MKDSKKSVKLSKKEVLLRLNKIRYYAKQLQDYCLERKRFDADIFDRVEDHCYDIAESSCEAAAILAAHIAVANILKRLERNSRTPS